MASSHRENDWISTTSKNIFVINPTIDDQMKFYPNHSFDIVDDDDDDNEHNMNEKEIWTKIREDFNMDYRIDNTLDNIEGDEEEQEFVAMESLTISDNDDDNDDEISEEQVLSQRLSQLSTNSSDYEPEPTIEGKRGRRRGLQLTTSESMSKKFRSTIDDDTIPDYLSMKNKLFDRMISKIVDTTVSSINVEDLRQMAFFMHKMVGFHLLYDLWSAYLQSGTGLLQETEDDDNDEEDRSIPVDRRYWPHYIKSLIPISPQDSSLTTERMTMKEKEQIACQNIVDKHLRDYQEKIDYYQKQFDEKKHHHPPLFPYWTATLEEAIHTFIQQYGLLPFRMKCDFRKAILIQQYKDEILQRQYEQHQPTDYQKRVAQRLYHTELQLETAKAELIEHRQRVICNTPPLFYDSLQVSMPASIHTLSNRPLRQQLLNRYEKLIQQTKTDLMSIYIAGKQTKIYQYQMIFNKEQDQMIQNDEKMTKSLKDLISKRSFNMHKQLKLKCNFTISYSIRNSFDPSETIKKDKPSIQRIGFLPSLIIDPTIQHQLTHRQLQLLKRGPTYVAPCQIHLSSLYPTIDQMISKQYAPLRHQLATIFDKYHADGSRSMNFQSETYQAFKTLYSIPLPNDIYQRALYEKKLIQSIRRFLNKNNLILRRTADQNTIFYLSNRTDFLSLSEQYMANNTANYRVLMNINEMNEQDVQEQLKKKYLSMNSELEKLFTEKRFHEIIHKKLQIKIETLKLPYLYFLPDVSTTTNAVQVKPMLSTHRSVTSKLAQFLKQLLRPLIGRYLNSTTFINEADFIAKLNSYTNQGAEEQHFYPTTLLATIKITNFHTMVSHESLVNKLVNFLTDHLPTNKLEYTLLKTMNRYHCIAIETIKKLTELYLKNNIFYYNGKIYEFIKGVPNSLLFSEILSNIYLFAYGKLIFNDPKLKTAFYGRYKNEFFFTWNRSPDELKLFLDSIAKKYSHLHIETSSGRCVYFFNTQIQNRHGHLYTCIHHDSQMPKYTLPYVVGHTKLNHRLWLRSALIRAVCFCSHFLDFKQEEIQLEMTCLANGYSIDFIERQLKHFYLRFNAEKIRFCLDQNIYEQLRCRVFDFLKTQRVLSDKNQDLEDQEYIFHFSYPYDYGPYHQFNKKFHELWKKYLQGDSQLSHKDTKIILETKHLYSLNTLLAQQKPSDPLLWTTTKKNIF